MTTHNKRREDRKNSLNQISANPGVTGSTFRHSVEVINSLIEDLEDSIDRNSRSNSRLSIVLVIATVVMALVAVANLYVTIKQGNQPSHVSADLYKNR